MLIARLRCELVLLWSLPLDMLGKMRHLKGLNHGCLVINAFPDTQSAVYTEYL